MFNTRQHNSTRIFTLFSTDFHTILRGFLHCIAQNYTQNCTKCLSWLVSVALFTTKRTRKRRQYAEDANESKALSNYELFKWSVHYASITCQLLVKLCQLLEKYWITESSPDSCEEASSIWYLDLDSAMMLLTYWRSILRGKIFEALEYLSFHEVLLTLLPLRMSLYL